MVGNKFYLAKRYTTYTKTYVLGSWFIQIMQLPLSMLIHFYSQESSVHLVKLITRRSFCIWLKFSHVSLHAMSLHSFLSRLEPPHASQRKKKMGYQINVTLCNKSAIIMSFSCLFVHFQWKEKAERSRALPATISLQWKKHFSTYNSTQRG